MTSKSWLFPGALVGRYIARGGEFNWVGEFRVRSVSETEVRLHGSWDVWYLKDLTEDMTRIKVTEVVEGTSARRSLVLTSPLDRDYVKSRREHLSRRYRTAFGAKRNAENRYSILKKSLEDCPTNSGARKVRELKDQLAALNIEAVQAKAALTDYKKKVPLTDYKKEVPL